MATTTSLNSDSAGSSKAHLAIAKPSSRFGLHPILLVLVTVLAAIARLHALTAKSFWLDEGFSVSFARLPWPRFLQLMASGETNMVLYYLLLRFWLMLGNSEGFIRGLSVLFSVATVPLIFFLGARLFGRKAGLLAAVLFAVNAYDIRYAQEARSYAMVVFFAVLATLILARNLQDPSAAHWNSYAIVCALLAYSHLYGILLVPAHAVSLLSWRRDEIPWRKYIRSLLTFGVMMVPNAIFLFAIYVLKIGAPPKLWFPPLPSDWLLILAVGFSGVYGRILVILDLLAVGIAALRAAQVPSSGEHTGRSWSYTLLFSWLVSPVLMVVTVSLVKPLFLPRFLIFCLPALLLLVAVGISQMRPAVLAWGLFTAISACSILGVLHYYQSDFDITRQDWRGVTSYVFDRAKPGDSIFFCEPAGESPFEYYTGRQKSASLKPVTLRSDTQKDGKSRNSSDLKSDDLVNVPGTNLRIAPPVGSRVWLVLMVLNGSVPEHEKGIAVAKWLSNGRQQVDERDFIPLRVMLYDRPANGLSITGDQASLSR